MCRTSVEKEKNRIRGFFGTTDERWGFTLSSKCEKKNHKETLKTWCQSTCKLLSAQKYWYADFKKVNILFISSFLVVYWIELFCSK